MDNLAASTIERMAPGARARPLRTALIAALAALVIAGAFALRIHAVGWGLPYSDHPDEGPQANRALGMLRRGDWNPHFFGKPSLYYYAVKLVFAAHLRYGEATGLYRSVADLPVTTDVYVAAPGLFVWGRWLTVLLGTATVAGLLWLGLRWWDVRVGMVAAALLAALPFHIRHSQYLTQDVPSAFLALLALWAALDLLKNPRPRAYVLAGVLAGLAASTKYNAGAVALAVAAAHLLAWRRESLRRIGLLALAGLCSVGAFVLTTPYIVLDFGTFYESAFEQLRGYGPQGSGDLRRTWPVMSYLRFFFAEGLAPLAALAALLGIGLAVARRHGPGVVLLAFVLPYPLIFLSQSTHYFRNMLPIIPPLALLAAAGVDGAAGWVELAWCGLVGAEYGEAGGPTQVEWTNAGSGPAGATESAQPAAPASATARRPSSLLVLALALLVVAGPLRSAVELTRFYAQPHSKVRAGDFVRERLPRGAPIAVALNPVQWSGWPLVVPLEDVGAQSPATYRSQGYRYVVALTEPRTAGYQALLAESRVLWHIAGDREGQPGPPLDVLDLGFYPEQLAIDQRPATFGRRLRLLGYQRGAGELRGGFSVLDGAQTIRPGQGLLINLYWQPLGELDVDYAIFLHLLDAQGNRVAQRDTVIRQADYPTSRWHPLELAVDLADLPIPADLPPGSYRLILGVYDMRSFARLPLPGATDGALELMTVDVS